LATHCARESRDHNQKKQNKTNTIQRNWFRIAMKVNQLRIPTPGITFLDVTHIHVRYQSLSFLLGGASSSPLAIASSVGAGPKFQT
jgi:hypothetical protein